MTAIDNSERYELTVGIRGIRCINAESCCSCYIGEGRESEGCGESRRRRVGPIPGKVIPCDSIVVVLIHSNCSSSCCRYGPWPGGRHRNTYSSSVRRPAIRSDGNSITHMSCTTHICTAPLKSLHQDANIPWCTVVSSCATLPAQRITSTVSATAPSRWT